MFHVLCHLENHTKVCLHRNDVTQAIEDRSIFLWQKCLEMKQEYEKGLFLRSLREEYPTILYANCSFCWEIFRAGIFTKWNKYENFSFFSYRGIGLIEWIKNPNLNKLEVNHNTTPVFVNFMTHYYTLRSIDSCWQRFAGNDILACWQKCWAVHETVSHQHMSY